MTSIFIDFLPDDLQPGVFVRRLGNGRERSDQEVLDYWRETLARFPGTKRTFVWNFSIALYDAAHGKMWSCRVEQRSFVADEFSKKIRPGYPMSSFLIPEGFDKPSTELTALERAQLDERVFSPFLEVFPTWLAEAEALSSTSNWPTLA